MQDSLDPGAAEGAPSTNHSSSSTSWSCRISSTIDEDLGEGEAPPQGLARPQSDATVGLARPQRNRGNLLDEQLELAGLMELSDLVGPADVPVVDEDLGESGSLYGSGVGDWVEEISRGWG